MKTLITGGVRSGKSRYALERAQAVFPDQPKCFIATAEPCDEEMRARILRHQKDRGNDFVTLEEPIRLAEAVASAEREFSVIVIDCLTFWMNNLLFRFSEDPKQFDFQIQSFLKTLETAQEKTSCLMITNEVGCGLVGANPLDRQFVDRLGVLNQEIGRLCEEVILVVAGVPNSMKARHCFVGGQGGIEIVRLDS